MIRWWRISMERSPILWQAFIQRAKPIGLLLLSGTPSPNGPSVLRPLIPAEEIPIQAGRPTWDGTAPTRADDEGSHLEVQGQLRQVGEGLARQVRLDLCLLPRVAADAHPVQ